jgi:hemerythrin-like domain-containing protein
MKSQAIQMLYDEHDVILKAIGQMNNILESEDLSSQAESLLWFVNFFREYGDLYHHHKEEDILFSLFEQKDLMMAEAIISALTEHHDMFREDLRSAQNAISTADWTAVRNIFKQYLSNLQDHISAENDEFFITAEQMLSDEEKESLYFSFLDEDRELDQNRKREYEKRILSEK